MRTSTTGPPPSWGGQAWEALNILLVRVETDDGAIGWGEAFSYNCMPAVQAMIDATVAPILIGRDAARVTSLMREVQQALHLFGRYGITMFAISAVDIALWDIAAKRAGLPLGQLLGGSATPAPVPGYASLLRYGDRERVASKVRAALDEGYPAIKLHETEEPVVAAAREAMGAGVPLCVDTNCPWTPAQAHANAGSAQGPRPALARGADLPAGGFLRARTPAARVRDRSRLRRGTPAPRSSSGACSTRERCATRSRA